MRDIEIITDDDIPIVATIRDASTDDCVVIAPGVGIRRTFYRHYADYLADNGFNSITFDSRGIGDSLRGSIRRSNATMTRWGKLDSNGVVRWARKRWNGALILTGHSAGGQLLGLLDEIDSIDAGVFVTVQSGYWGHWPFPNRYVLGALWLFMPLMARTIGYFPARMFRLGEDLPSGVAAEWSKWGRSPGYLFDHVPEEDLRRYQNFDRPLLWWSFSDDSYAPPGATRAMISRYPSSDIDHRHIRPADVQRRSIGHFGYFRPESNDTLWKRTIEWLKQRRWE